MKATKILLCLLSVLVFFSGGNSTIVAPVPLPPICATVLCAEPDCPKPIPPGPGECCSTCPPDEPPTLDCRLVFCPAPNCPNPLPLRPGQCCKECPANPPLKCPKLPPDSFGLCAELCSANDDCPKGQLCCSNGCGHQCMVGVPDVCIFEGVTYSPGDSFPAGDGCNTCSCNSGGLVACTKKACLPVCVRDGVVYNVGESFPAGDGCNKCTCVAPGDIACTEIACPCPVKGQVFTNCGSACPANCTTPNPICTRQCVPRCECPRGQVIDETRNRCVPVRECPSTCPPDKPMVYCFVDPCLFARCPAHPNARCVADYCGGCNACFFVGKEEVTNACKCPVKGQVFTNCGSACPANCTTPSPICTRQCVPRCECPRGQVIDETRNRCVPVRRCPGSCPPLCTAALCKRNKWAKCTIPGPREIPGCTGSCQFTFCSACYFSKEPRPLPGSCPTCGGPISSVRCFKKWANCICEADREENGATPVYQQTEENFRCYRYPCPLRG